ncbi:hypothetical protein CEUSTIGMA_g10299.t1 [Chlamydomonas eustigma]|uniref:ABC transporter domain-containing protein n=1 Tax=Chlamydomonas eustigma TaxID=1157962 RepID=A0A250XIK7_9CHLO|nr:hypothetical protein CEUSTIGMA_g10299.t1 [Chlamydomonas eustigma]|eukprot:GAX82873.1 hypothetical protein CEUSTIGMA_g10299.t1 [Chlamydomonas eustigma]
MGPPTRRNVQDEERVALAKKLLSFNDDDSSFLEKTGVLIEKYHIRPPAVTVTYQDLTVTTRALVGASAIPTVGNALIGLLLRVVGMSPRRAETDLKILDGLNGILKPGRLTLLLGPPSCGKSTMMKVLSGRLRETPIMHTAGKITYNGVEMDKFHAQRTSAYVDQMDNHNGNLTVQETLLYAHACQSGLHGTPFQIAQDMLATRNAGKGDASTAEFEEVLHKAMVSDARVAVWMNMVGLIHCKDTNVGDAMNRGISGGEKKRVTMAEMLVGPRNVMFLDEISTGLDSATLFTIVKSLSQMSHASRPTCLVSLLQPPPETFQLFDDVIMIADGVILYHGPVTDVIPFFNTLGFDCPPRKDIPSFLLEVTTSAGQLNYATAELRRTMGLPAAEAQPVAEGVSKEKMPVLRKELIVPVKNMAAMFWKDNEHGQAMLRELGVPIDPSSTHPGSLVNTSYALSAWESIVVTTKRQATLMMRDQVLLKARMIQTVVISLITGSLFYMLPITENGARSYFGACFMSILFLAFGGFPQLPITLEMKKVFFKHRENYFIPAYAQGIAMAVVQMPVSFLEVTLFSLIIYFMVGFYMAPSYFFTFFAICFSLSLVASGLFRFIACLSPDMVIGNALGGLAIVLLIVTSGFVIVKGSIPPWMIWAVSIELKFL